MTKGRRECLYHKRTLKKCVRERERERKRERKKETYVTTEDVRGDAAEFEKLRGEELN